MPRDAGTRLPAARRLYVLPWLHVYMRYRYCSGSKIFESSGVTNGYFFVTYFEIWIASQFVRWCGKLLIETWTRVCCNVYYDDLNIFLICSRKRGFPFFEEITKSKSWCPNKDNCESVRLRSQLLWLLIISYLLAVSTTIRNDKRSSSVSFHLRYCCIAQNTKIIQIDKIKTLSCMSVQTRLVDILQFFTSEDQVERSETEGYKLSHEGVVDGSPRR